MLNGVTSLGGLISGELDNALGPLQSVLGDEAEGLGGLLELRRVRLDVMENPIKILNELLGLLGERVPSLRVVVDLDLAGSQFSELLFNYRFDARQCHFREDNLVIFSILGFFDCGRSENTPA